MTGTGRKERRMFQKEETPCFFSVTNFFDAGYFSKQAQNIVFFRECVIIKSQSNRVQKNKK